jgi:hypothetical protein
MVTDGLLWLSVKRLEMALAEGGNCEAAVSHFVQSCCGPRVDGG